MIQMTDKEFENFCRVMQENYGIDLKKKRVLIEYRMIAEVKKRGMHSLEKFVPGAEIWIRTPFVILTAYMEWMILQRQNGIPVK